jgi:SAM-dependent methyltransferase
MPTMAEPLEYEFGTMAEWTHEAIRELGRRYAIPAACRGSGSPAMLDWLLERLAPRPAERMLDAGAGLGGPAAWARSRLGTRPVCFDSLSAGCQAAAAVFGLPAVLGDAGRLPFADGSFQTAWSLGTLCTTAHRPQWLAEMRRVLRDGAVLGLFVVVSTGAPFSTTWGNNFPADGHLGRQLTDSGFRVTARCWSSDCPGPDARWQRAERAVAETVRHRHGTDPRFARVMEQQDRTAGLLEEGRVRGRLIVARAD